ncbi:hypothetical protein [Novosphingobium sp. KACC 22771]|uniref:hypothetical protein n=1 Tax=Novosphingobium sp. KACC 22771 TaxID=3025670 RepID=UPI002365360D|nr:hypothetical protein [Novosphingobium sp. KACC 22771]WDF73897.1 hypothetical protein PQ467_07650 [Novosphingobium sp. KACC 22771]
MLLNTIEDTVVYVPRAERVSFDLMVRARFGEYRGPALMKNLTCGGARVEGIAGLRCGDKVTLCLPLLAPKEATVMWLLGDDAGLEFDRPLHPDIFEDLVLHHASRRERTDTDRLTQINNRYEREEAENLPH